MKYYQGTDYVVGELKSLVYRSKSTVCAGEALQKHTDHEQPFNTLGYICRSILGNREAIGSQTWPSLAPKQHSGYSYLPRKPSEKKRRMTKRKAAMLQNLARISAAGNVNQMTSTPQLPLLSFSTLPDNPMLREFILDPTMAVLQ